MSNFGNYKKFENVGIRSSNDTLIVMDSSNNNISLHSSDGGDDNVDTLSIKNIINKTPNMDLNLSSLNGTTINPVITINNNHGDCRIMTNLNVNGNLNITGSGMIKTTGIGSFGSIHCGVGTFTDSLITNGNLFLGSSNSSSNDGKKIYFHYHDSTTGGSYLYNSGTNYLIYQSGSHWGAVNFGIKTNSAAGAWAYLRFYTWNGSDYISAYQGSLQHSGSWTAASDDRLKTDEKKITSEKGKEIIMKLRPQTYYKHQELNSTYDGPKLDSCKIYEAGFIAQEIYFEIPELRFLLSGLSKDHKEMSEIDINNIDFSNIQEDPNYSIFGNDILGVSYEQIVPYLTAHNQEQQKEIDTLKTESQQQQTEITILKTENQQQQIKMNELTSIIDKLKTANSFEEFKQTF